MRSAALHRCVGLGLALFPSATALAGPGDEALKLGTHVEIRAELSQPLREQLQHKVEDGVARSDHDHVVFDPEDCGDAACVREAAAAAGATHVVDVQIDAEGPDAHVRVTLAAVDGSVVASSEETCEICGQAELATFVADVVAAVIPRADRIVSRVPMLRVAGVPAGATVAIDGVVVGTTPFEGEVPEGAHRISISAQGHQIQDRTLELSPGVEEVIDYALTPTPEKDRFATARRVGGWTALATGVGLLGSGAALLILDGREHKASCPRESLDVMGHCPNVYTTFAPGVGLSVGGVVLAGAGVTLLVLDRRKRARLGARTQARWSGGGGLTVRF